MGSGAVIYVPSFIKIGSGIHKLIGGDTHRQHGDLISLISVFKCRLRYKNKKHISQYCSNESQSPEDRGSVNLRSAECLRWRAVFNIPGVSLRRIE
jgi:hypothetical protein